MSAQMHIDLDFDPRFVAAMQELREEYGDEMPIMNGFSNHNLNFSSFIDNFIDTKVVADVSIDANANSGTHDVRTLMNDMTKPHMKLICFNKIFFELCKQYGEETAKDWLRQEWTGGFYLHNSSTSTLLPYCYAYDLDKLVEQGLFFINRFKTKACQHLTTFNDHVLEFIGWCANRSSGAVGLPSYLVYSWYFWNKDVKNGFYLKDPEYYRRQCFQKFVYDLNQPYLRITECAFTNISIMDRPYLEELFGGRIFPDGTYAIDHIEEIIEHQKVFMEVVSETRSQTMQTFPVITYSLLYQNGKFVDEEFAKWCNRHNMNWYDANFYVGNDVTTLSNCCRLLSDTSKLDAFINSIGGTALSVGSVQVNTINLRRISLESGNDEKKYLELLKDRVNLNIKVLTTIRGIIRRNIEKGLLPNYTYGLVELDKQYSTIGITAMYEVMEDYGYINVDKAGNHYYSDDAMKFSAEIMALINELKDAADVDFKFNVECIPAERANVVLAKKDRWLYPDKPNYHLYSNQWIPLTSRCTLQEKVRLGAALDKECGGGQISHINLESRFSTEEQAWDLLNYIASQGVIYFAYNTKIAVCAHEHAFYGDICPVCGEPVADYFTRVVGFLTPVSSWIKERREEYQNRQWFNKNDWMTINDSVV